MTSLNYDIFVATTQTAEEFAHAIEAILNIRLRPVTGNEIGFITHPEFHLYIYSDREAKMWLRIGTHSYEDDTDYTFSIYSFVIEVGASGISNNTESLLVARVHTREIFDKLKASNRFRLLMLHELTQQLDKYDPDMQT